MGVYKQRQPWAAAVIRQSHLCYLHLPPPFYVHPHTLYFCHLHPLVRESYALPPTNQRATEDKHITEVWLLMHPHSVKCFIFIIALTFKQSHKVELVSLERWGNRGTEMLGNLAEVAATSRLYLLFFLMIFFLHLFYFWLCWVFLAAKGFL